MCWWITKFRENAAPQWKIPIFLGNPKSHMKIPPKWAWIPHFPINIMISPKLGKIPPIWQHCSIVWDQFPSFLYRTGMQTNKTAVNIEIHVEDVFWCCLAAAADSGRTCWKEHGREGGPTSDIKRKRSQQQQEEEKEEAKPVNWSWHCCKERQSPSCHLIHERHN